jgi:predicted permease
MLSEALWRREFGGTPDVLGTAVLLDGEPHEVIGVLPSSFRYPERSVAYWRPMRFEPGSYEDRDNTYLMVIARLGDAVTVDRARAEMTRIMASLAEEYPDAYERTGATVNLLRDEVSSRSRLLLIALSGSALAVLLIACTNLANLLIARSISRGRELSVRASLGAGRDRLMRQLLTESIGLAVIGGIAGIGAAAVSLPMLSRLVPESLPAAATLSLDARVLVFALAITLGTGIAFGAFPALRSSRIIDVSGLRERGSTGGVRGRRLRNALVTVEVAASVALLIAAGLLIRALVQLQSTDPGFDAENVVTMRTWLPTPEYAATAKRGEFYDRVLGEVRALPGVESAAYASFLPIAEGGGIWPVTIEGDTDAGDFATASLRFITSGWFESLRIPLLRGRDVRSTDTFISPFVAIVSESFAERHWPGRDPIGQTFLFAFFDRTVVGVAGDIAMRGREQSSEPQVWIPYLQAPEGGVIRYAPKDLVVRARGDAMSLVPAIREIVRRADPRQPVSDIRLLEEIVAGETAPRMVQLRLVGAFSAIAFLLAAIGLHGLLSFTASRRSHEIGVRLALGARRSTILGLVARQAAIPAGIGIIAGATIGYAAGRAMQGLLAGIPPADTPTFAAAITLALVMALAGSLQPAVRAARTDPRSVLMGGE